MSNRLVNFIFANDRELQELKSNTEAAGANGRGYIYKDCELLDGCRPHTCDIGFGYIQDVGNYLLYTVQKVHYRGSNTYAKTLFDNQNVAFTSFDQLCSFLQSMAPAPSSGGTAPSPQPQPVRTEIEPNAYTDPEKIEVPDADKPQNIIISPEDFQNGCRKKVSGQEEALKSVALMTTNFLGKYYPKRPLSLLFYGPTGVGKTELAKTMCKVINQHAPAGAKYDFQTEDLSQYQEKHSAYRLIGAPPGYVGYGDPTIFDKTFDNPRQILVFDELDKAHPDVLKVLMRAIDEGKHARNPSEGNSSNFYDLSRCIMIFTSNIEIDQKNRNIGFSSQNDETEFHDEITPIPVGESMEDAISTMISNNEKARISMSRQGYLPEVVGRINGFIPFKNLKGNAMIDIAVKAIAEGAAEYGLRLNHISEDIVQFILNKFTSSAGARTYHTLTDVYLGAHLAAAARQYQNCPVNLEGTVSNPSFQPVESEPVQDMECRPADPGRYPVPTDNISPINPDPVSPIAPQTDDDDDFWNS